MTNYLYLKRDGPKQRINSIKRVLADQNIRGSRSGQRAQPDLPGAQKHPQAVSTEGDYLQGIDRTVGPIVQIEAPLDFQQSLPHQSGQYLHSLLQSTNITNMRIYVPNTTAFTVCGSTPRGL